MARTKAQVDITAEFPLCESCHLPIHGVRVGARQGWLHTWCAPDAPPQTLEALLKRERISLILRQRLLSMIPADLQGAILRAYLEARAKEGRD